LNVFKITSPWYGREPPAGGLLNMFKKHRPSGVAMSSIVVTYLAYLLISVGLIVVVGQVLSRSGRLFLLDVLGGSDRAATGISTLIVVTFYLIGLGFVALTMRTSGDSITARQAIQLLATKIGEVLLVLGALYLAGIVTLTRLRRKLRGQGQSGITDQADSSGPASTPKSAPPAGLSSPHGLWRPASRGTAP
jgi:hypothetical protein